MTSKNVGLAVPDWPTSYGYHMWAMPFSLWKGGIFYEHIHRVIASVIFVLMLALTILLLFVESRKRVRGLALVCLGAVVVQAILGGMTVLFMLPKAVSVFHGVLAQVFFSLTIVLTYVLSREHLNRCGASGGEGCPSMRRSVAVLLALVAVQLVIAAVMRHDIKRQGGIAIPDFPTVAGRWMPMLDGDTVDWVNQWREDAVMDHGADFSMHEPIRLYQVVIHFLHRMMALAIVCAAVAVTLALRRSGGGNRRIAGTVYGLNGLIILALALGILTVWTNKGHLITTFHVVTGALILGGAVLLMLRVYPPLFRNSTS